MQGYFTVTSLNTYIKEVLDNDFNLSRLYIRGEISNFKKYSDSGHCYFSIKDEKSTLNVVMFGDYAKKLIFEPKNGDDVMILGKISSYPSRGQYQLYAFEMTLFGLGNQLVELEKLKQKLKAEGLFDESKKREITKFPSKIGVITGKNSAAQADIVKNISRRFPLCEIFLFPAIVQGDTASKDLLRAFKLSQQYELDTLIIGRGGGSNEDLNAFNDEELVREVAKSKCPIISAVGHEIDFTLIDFVADKRASTPTGAAEIATPDIEEIKLKLLRYLDEWSTSFTNKIEGYKNRLDIYKKMKIYQKPEYIYEDYIRNIKILENQLNSAMTSYLELKREEIKGFEKHLNSLNPKSVLSRGYLIAKNKQGKVITSLNDVNRDDEIQTILKDGTITSKVIRKDNNNGKEN